MVSRHHNTPEAPSFIAIGKVVGTHGTRGSLKVLAYSGIPERFFSLKTVYLPLETGLTGFVVQQVTLKGHHLLLDLQGVETREQARELIGQEIYVPQEQQISLPEDVYFIHDLVGLSVYDVQRGYLGQLEEVIQGAANDVYVVRQNGKEILIPAVHEFVKQIDLENRRMLVQLIEGMDELNAD